MELVSISNNAIGFLNTKSWCQEGSRKWTWYSFSHLIVRWWDCSQVKIVENDFNIMIGEVEIRSKVSGECKLKSVGLKWPCINDV